ncbi:N-acetylmuramoyl-L-alanine amidase family protein [Luteibacter rhizovicinus]|nr:N-acetylmuramoyl-L-alanine amidase [Luteibacter rhizovicinus]
MSQLTEDRRAELEIALTHDIGRTVNTSRHFSEQVKDINLLISFDIPENEIVVELGEEYGMLSRGSEMEDLEDLISNDIRFQLEGVVSFDLIDFRFGGKDMYFYFPEERPEPESKPAMQVSTLTGPLMESPPRVVVTAGHGVYRNYQWNDWRAQRDEHNGITEDYLTPAYADVLEQLLKLRSGVDVLRARTFRGPPHYSNRLWADLSARYHLQALYPELPAIWHSLPQSTDSMRERDEGLRTTPLYANHIGAKALINLHTNGGETSATGVQVLFHEKKIESAKLADSILCAMKEQIHTDDRWKGYRVPDKGHAVRNKAETRLGNMPSVIVEAGFHTNPNDAEMLTNRRFQLLSMRGVEKGYRLYSEGKTCAPLELKEIVSAPGNTGSKVPVAVHFNGHPQFPVRVIKETLSCPEGWSCLKEKTDRYELPQPSPLAYESNCPSYQSQDTVTAVQRLTMIDTDGVITSAEHSFVCNKGGA